MDFDEHVAAPRSTRPVWGAVAAAAAVVLVLGSVVALVGRDDPDAAPAPPAAAEDDGTFRLGPDQVPSVFGYSVEDAVAVLEERGFDVQTTESGVARECDEEPNRAVAVDPPPGTVFGQGAQVTLFTSRAASSARCFLPTYHRADAWALIDFANGRGPRPDTTAGVDLEPLLERLRVWSTEVGRYAGRRMSFPTPTLTTAASTREAPCGKLPPRLRERKLLALTVALPERPTDGVPWSACQTAYIGFDDQGRIDDFYVPDDIAAEGGATPADVVGNTVAVATERLEAQGFRVEPIERTDCQPVGLVTAQQPYPYAEQDVRPGMTVFVAFTEADGACVKDSLDIQTPARKATEQLVAFARGGPLPPVADEIDLYLANEPNRQISAAEAADPRSWELATACRDTGSTSSTAGCLATLVLTYAATEPVSYIQPLLREDDDCHVVNAELPDELTSPDAWSRSASFVEGEPRSCSENWEVQLWLDEEGRIFAVNLLLGDPEASY